MKIPLFACLLYALPAFAQFTAQSSTLLVANQKDHTLSFIDPATGRQTFALQEDRVTGHEVAVSPDGRTAYLPIYGDAGVGRPGTDGREMLVVDIPSRTITHTVDFGHGVRPHLPLYDTRRDLVYISTELDQAIAAVDPRSLKILYSIPTGAAESHMFALSHDGRFAYTANVGPSSVSVLDLDAHRTVAIIPVGRPGIDRIQRITVSKDDKLLFTSDWDKPRLAVIDIATRKLKAWVPLPGTGYGGAVTPDGRLLILCLSNAAKVAVLDLVTLTIVRTIDVPRQPQEVLIRPDGRVAYISCNTDGKVAALDLETWRVRSIIDAGGYADGLAWADSSSPSPTSR